MKKGKFTRVKRLNTYLELLDSSSNYYNHIFIPCKQPILSNVYDYYRLIEEDDVHEQPIEEITVTDFVNSLCFKILDSYGIVYNESKNILERVVYTWDQNLIPGEKFIGIKINKLIGTEESIQDLFPNILMKLDILDCFRFDLNGYIGLTGNNYRLYLPYTEDSLDLYKEYLESMIYKQFSSNLERKIKIGPSF